MKGIDRMNEWQGEMLPSAKKLYIAYMECGNYSQHEKSWQQGYCYEVYELIDQLERLQETHPSMLVENSLKLVKKSIAAINKEEWLHVTYQLYEELKETIE